MRCELSDFSLGWARNPSSRALILTLVALKQTSEIMTKSDCELARLLRQFVLWSFTVVWCCGVRGGGTYLWRRCPELCHLWGAPLSPGQTWATVPRPAPTGPTAEEQEITPSMCRYHQINQKYDIFCFHEKKKTVQRSHPGYTLRAVMFFTLHRLPCWLRFSLWRDGLCRIVKRLLMPGCLFFCARSKQTSARNVNGSPPEWQIRTCWGSKRGRSVPDALKKKPCQKKKPQQK